MLKPSSLRSHITAALPELARDPERLVMLVAGGRIVSTLTQSLSYEYAYTLRLLVLDYAGHADAIIAPILVWLRSHQPEMLDNDEKREKGFRFDAEYLTTTAMDLVIELDLTERVITRPRQGLPGAMDLHHVGEPAHVLLHSPGGLVPPPDSDPFNQAQRWSFWLQDEKLAEWDYDPRPPALRG